MSNIYITNFVPKSCPYCGNPLRLNLSDFFGHASMSCQKCGTHFCYASSYDLIKVADDIGSDLSNYVEDTYD